MEFNSDMKLFRVWRIIIKDKNKLIFVFIEDGVKGSG